MARRQKVRRKSPPRRRAAPKRRLLPWRRWLAGAFGILLVAGLGYTAWLDHVIHSRFEGRRWALPARIYGRALELYPGMVLARGELEDELKLLGYRASSGVQTPGTYRRKGEVLEVHTRGFSFWDGRERPRILRLDFETGRLAAVSATDKAQAELVRLEPPLIGRIYPADNEDRVLVRLEDVPDLLRKALIASEDHDFYQHIGIDPRGIARALWMNLRAGRAVQGGSTLTQQLVKNYFLSDERTLTRKINEALMALLLERRYSKNEILQAYMNEIYMGQQGSRAVHGFGLAAEFYFGRPLNELRLPDLALLVALVRGANYYNPRRHPQRALARRNLVLDLMQDQKLVSGSRAAAARKAPLGVTREPPPAASPYPAFIDLVRRQLRRDYQEEDLHSEGLQIFTTLDPRVQALAEKAVTRRLPLLEQAAGLPAGSLQAALVVTDVQSGEVQAVVGDRSPRMDGFNRALDAQRLIGSLVKPAIYLTALGPGGGYTAASLLRDEPIQVRGARGVVWSPKNYDKRAHGQVPLHRALAESYNLATVRLGMNLGLPKIVRTLHRLGVEQDLPAYPSVLLGAVSLSPLDVSQMYQTLAGLGFQTPLRAIREVTGPDSKPLRRYRLTVEQAAGAEAVYVLDWILQEALREGTGRSVYARLPGHPALAGKTGTTDDLRDSWYAGFGQDRAAVVWVGRDDNRPAGLSGAQGALQVWGDLMQALHPAAWAPPVPDGIRWQWVDSTSGAATDAGCPGSLRMPFVEGTVPEYRACRLAVP